MFNSIFGGSNANNGVGDSKIGVGVIQLMTLKLASVTPILELVHFGHLTPIMELVTPIIELVTLIMELA